MHLGLHEEDEEMHPDLLAILPPEGGLAAACPFNILELFLKCIPCLNHYEFIQLSIAKVVRDLESDDLLAGFLHELVMVLKWLNV